ncbi:hypothetical protein CHARACLAT_008533 [Characodon lateralis]|uniref:Uncharacterized protein n=1 Tax=Characodon lateralis TaxID=208331 RepID=A0ABU7D856_9TELE|nr:hypothetical protein [Characodon lateralis]
MESIQCGKILLLLFAFPTVIFSLTLFSPASLRPAPLFIAHPISISSPHAREARGGWLAGNDWWLSSTPTHRMEKLLDEGTLREERSVTGRGKQARLSRNDKQK